MISQDAAIDVEFCMRMRGRVVDYAGEGLILARGSPLEAKGVYVACMRDGSILFGMYSPLPLPGFVRHDLCGEDVYFDMHNAKNYPSIGKKSHPDAISYVCNNIEITFEAVFA